MNVVDLHCDLLAYLSVNPQRSALDGASRCSIPQMKAGSVKLQTMAVFTETNPISVQLGLAQFEIYKKLPVHYPADIAPFQGELKDQQIMTLMAIENASGFCLEGEPLQKGIDRLKSIMREVKPLYISLTWNSENRFGGGALAKAGLKDDGKQLLEELHQQNIAVDLSHASDALAHDILNFMISKGLEIPVIASHSNSRLIANYPRNLPDDIAKEIFRRKGVIGLNLFQKLIGESEEDILKTVNHWLELGGEKQICFGADFFCEADVPKTSMTYQLGCKPFFDAYSNASCYRSLLDMIQKELRLSNSLIEGIAYRNFLEYYRVLKRHSLQFNQVT